MAFRYTNRGVYKKRASTVEERQNLRAEQRRRNAPTPFQFSSPVFLYPPPDDLDLMTIKTYTWQYGDKFWKIASKFYGDSKAWWVIPWFNKKPLEADWRPGDIVEIPFPLNDMYQYIY